MLPKFYHPKNHLMNELRKRDSDILTLESQIIGGVGVIGGGRGGWTGLKK